MPKDKDINILKRDVENSSRNPDDESAKLVEHIAYTRAANMLGIDLEREKTKNTILREDHAARKRWSTIIFVVVIVYLISAPVLMCLQPLLKIHDSVIITFLGTTVVNTIGLLAIVLGYFFPRKQN